MSRRNKYLLLIGAGLFYISSIQQLFSQHQYLIQLKNNTIPSLLNQNLIAKQSSNIRIAPISIEERLYKLDFDSQIQAVDIENSLKQDPNILYFRKSELAQPRGCPPNDPKYSDQYNLNKMNFDEIWCSNNSGLSPSGDSIVVGIIDLGFNHTLPDIKPNVYINYKEIPDNLKDDDQNGYIDDFIGLNGRIGTGDNHPFDEHGTRVSSILGAKGNNGIVMTGAAQNIKMILCSATTDSEMILCYNYFYEMRKKYNETNGQKGAYIVSTNTSLGFDKAFPTDKPELCNVYTKLFQVGVLNAAATVNRNWNIDIEGDLPATCPSLALVGVTNTDQTDQKVIDAGYGMINIDIAASGENIPCIDHNGNYSTLEGGCSFSSPQVAAAIALMYQFCPRLTSLSKTKPDSAVLFVRDVLLTSGPSLFALKGITTSSRRLDAEDMRVNLFTKCNLVSLDTNSPGILVIPNPFTDYIDFKFKPSEGGTYDLEIFNELGQSVYFRTSNFPAAANSVTIGTNSWNSGAYYLRIKSKTQKYSKTLVKI